MARALRALLLLGGVGLAIALVYWGSTFAEAPRRPETTLASATGAPESARPAPRATAVESPTSPAESPQQIDSPPPSGDAPFEKPATEEDYWTELEALKRTDKKRALAYALQGDEWYSETGKPAEARRAMVVTLLVDLEQMPEARERTRDFIRRYPNSPYRPLVQGVTGIHPRPGAPPGHQQ